MYFNIGSCSEQCWLNHLTDLRQLDPTLRNFGQTPFDIGQCRRDCPNFRAIEDRLPDILAFLMSKETDATDLAVARANAKQAVNPKATYTSADLQRDLDKQFGANAVARGREVFATTCARCHSSIAETPENTFKNRDFTAVNARRHASRLAGLRPGDAGDRSRFQPLSLASLEPHERAHMAGVRLRDSARAADGSEHQGATRRRSWLVSQHLAAVAVGACAVHAQQCDRSGAVRPAGQQGQPVLSLAVRRREQENVAGRQGAGVLGL